MFFSESWIFFFFSHLASERIEENWTRESDAATTEEKLFFTRTQNQTTK